MNGIRDNRAHCCHFLPLHNIPLLGELNKTGQFHFLLLFSGFYPHLQQRFRFFIYFRGRFQSSHPQNNILYPIARNKRKAANWLCLLKLLETFHCAGLQNLNLGPAVFGGVSASEESSSFSPFQSTWVHTNALEERAFFPPLAKIQVYHQERRGFSVEIFLTLAIKPLTSQYELC